MGVALSSTFFGERHYAGQKETDLCKNEDKYLADFQLYLSIEILLGHVMFLKELIAAAFREF